MLKINCDKFENEIKIKTKAEYSHYVVNIIKSYSGLKQILGSAIMPISFDGQNKALEAITDVLNQHYKTSFSDFGCKNLDFVEHSSTELLCQLETNFNDEYKNHHIIPLTSFRGRVFDSGKIFFNMPNHVDVHFFLVNGDDLYHSAVELHAQRESELIEEFNQTVIKASGVKQAVFTFLTEHTPKTDRFKYMSMVLDIIEGYIIALETPDTSV